MAVVLCLCAAAAQAATGIQITEKTTGAGHDLTSRIQIDQHRMRVETTGAEAGHRAFVFDGTKQVLWILNVDKQTYQEVTKEDLQRLSQQVSGAMAQMQAQLEKMPPEQRKRMEEMMKNMPGMPGGAQAKIVPTTYRKTGTATVGKWTCQVWEGQRDGQKVSEVCTVPPAALGFSPADFDVARQLGGFFQQIMPANADRMFSVGGADDNGTSFTGIPVRRVDFGGAGQTVSEITDIGRQDFPDSTFEVPAGFRKEPFAVGPRP